MTYSASTNPRPAGKDAPSSRGRPRSAEAEQAILRAALEILDDVGYGSFSIEAVAARAGAGRPTIYQRWPSKLELAAEAVVRLAPPSRSSTLATPWPTSAISSLRSSTT
jgi:AcrR family transcriptional regulator